MSLFLRNCTKLNRIYTRNIKTTSSCLKTPDNLDEYTKVFAFPHVVRVAVFQRLKIYMTGACVGLYPLVLANGTETTTSVALLSLISVSCTGLMVIGEFMRRVVGIVYIDKNQTKVRFAHITFWGKRSDIEVNIDDIKFASETNQNFQNIYWLVKFQDPKQSSLIISTRFGGIEDPDKFKLIFGDVPELPKIKSLENEQQNIKKS